MNLRTHGSRSLTSAALTSVMVVASLAAGGTALLAVSPAAASVTIDAPAAPAAGTVELTGSVGTEPGSTTSVLFVLDATQSTGQPTGLDCSGDGVAGGAEDDLNGDGVRGDVLDCEIAGVQSLNDSLAGTVNLQVGLVAFANQAAAANLGPAGSTTFLPPGFTGGDPRPRIHTVAGSIQRDRIGLYEPKELGGSGSGTAFTGAVSTALTTLSTAPAGPKWIMFLSDGQSGIDDTLLDDLSGSGVRLRSFAIGSSATCNAYGSLFKMAAVTGEACQVVAEPSALAAGLVGSQPDQVSGVTVSIGDVAVAATVGAVGGWRAGFTLGAGTYTAKVRATLVSGAVRTAQRTFTVVATPAGPPAGSVAPASGSLRATAVEVTRPQPSRAVLPARVTGRVGRPVRGFSTTRALTRSRVLLQARSGAGAEWATVATDRVARDGRFALRWKPLVRLTQLRVALAPSGRFAGSAAAVPEASISACKVLGGKGGKGGWSVTCRTIARAGSVVRLLDGRVVESRTTVHDGTFRLRGTGPIAGARIELALGARRHVHLTL